MHGWRDARNNTGIPQKTRENYKKARKKGRVSTMEYKIYRPPGNIDRKMPPRAFQSSNGCLCITPAPAQEAPAPFGLGRRRQRAGWEAILNLSTGLFTAQKHNAPEADGYQGDKRPAGLAPQSKSNKLGTAYSGRISAA
jgi:hypothetical protein